MTNFVFFGTDEFSVKVLEELKRQNLTPELIVTTPDSKKGRGQILTPSPVKIWAQKEKIPCDYTLSPKPYNLFIIASYGKIISRTVLDLPKHGTLNIHPSLLPKYRGAAPLQSAILNGDAETGVSIMLVDEQMDHGPILVARSLELGAWSFIELRNKLAKMGAELLAEILPDYLAGKIKPVEQDHAAATSTKKITKELGQLNLADSPAINDRKIRALNPNPGTYFIDDNGRRVKVISAHLENDQLIFDRVIPEGKKEMGWESYRHGLTKQN